MKRSFLFAAVLAAFAAAPAAAQPDAQIRAMMEEAGQKLAERGLTAAGATQTGGLAAGAKQSLTFNLAADTEYLIIGLCDTDCTDLDLTLFDAAGRQISADVAEDDFPVVSVKTTTAGTYRVEVLMAACSAAPCGFGVAAYSH